MACFSTRPLRASRALFTLLTASLWLWGCEEIEPTSRGATTSAAPLTLPEPKDAEAQWLEQAEIVAQVRVIDTRSYSAPMGSSGQLTAIWTEVTFETVRRLRQPEALKRRFSLRFLGGTLPDGKGMQLADSPLFSRGEELLLVARQTDDGWPTRGTWGVIPIRDGEVARRALGALAPKRALPERVAREEEEARVEVRPLNGSAPVTHLNASRREKTHETLPLNQAWTWLSTALGAPPPTRGAIRNPLLEPLPPAVPPPVEAEGIPPVSDEAAR